MVISAHILNAASRLEVIGRCVDAKVATSPAGAARVNTVAAPDSALPSDEALISRIARGEQAALCTLMSRHHTRISRFVRRFVSDRSLVEDLVYDTFFAAWQQAPHFEKRSSVTTWLLAIARYKALSARERRILPTEPLDDAPANTLVDSRPRPDAVVERDDSARFLRQCLGSLPAEQALLIELVYYRDKSIKEVALLTGIPENTVKSRMFLARKKLAAMLKAADAASGATSLVPNATPAAVVVKREFPREVSCAEIASAKRLVLT